MQEKAKLTSTPEYPTPPVPVPESTQSKLKKLFKRAVLPLLNSVSKEELCRAFQSCTDEEQRRLHQLFIKVITSLHGNIEDNFKSLCDEMQVGAALDTFDRLLEEQSLDPLITDKTNVLDTVRALSMARKSEVQSLTRCLEKAEEHNRQLQTRIELLKKRQQDFLVSANSIKKLVLTRAVNYKRSEASNSLEEMVASTGKAVCEDARLYKMLANLMGTIVPK